MPLPFIIGAIAAAAGAVGVGKSIKAACDLSDASDTAKRAKNRDERNTRLTEDKISKTRELLDILGRKEAETVAGFKRFQDIFERIRNRPTFSRVQLGNVIIPSFDPKVCFNDSVTVATLLGAAGGLAAGTGVGFAAAGATSAAVMALGTASTGTAIASLSGAAATNATLAALGGGSLAAGGGGMALGSAVLGGATLGVGLLVGGLIFGGAASKQLERAQEAMEQVRENEEKGRQIREFLESVIKAADSHLQLVRDLDWNYALQMKKFSKVYEDAYERGRQPDGSVDYFSLSEDEKMVVENTVLLVNVLHKLCTVKLLNEDMSVNTREVNEVQAMAAEWLNKRA